MREKIITTDRENLKLIIKKEMRLNGNNCDLNHIDIAKITDLDSLFWNCEFNGDISNWDTSNVTNMNYLFRNCKFNGDISNWRPLKVKYTTDMFFGCTAPIPYWFGDNNKEVLKKIDSHDLFNKMNKELNSKEIKIKKTKI